MLRNLSILLAAALVVALPFLFRKPEQATSWKPGDPELVVVTPHNEAIRTEFERAFSRWHEERFGQPVHIDWRAIGGTTEIMRYLGSEFVASARAWSSPTETTRAPPASTAATAPLASTGRVAVAARARRRPLRSGRAAAWRGA